MVKAYHPTKHWKLDLHINRRDSWAFKTGLYRTTKFCWWYELTVYHYHLAICAQRFKWRSRVEPIHG